MVVSSNTSLEHEKELLKQDIEYFIRKPIDVDILYYIIKNIVNFICNIIPIKF